MRRVFERYGAGEVGPNVSSYPLFSRLTTNTCLTGGGLVAAPLAGAAATPPPEALTRAAMTPAASRSPAVRTRVA